MGEAILVARDVEKIEEDWGSLQWLAGAAQGNARGLTLGRVVIRKGCHNPRHRHPDCEEALYLLSGRLLHTIGDAEVVLEAGDTLVIPADVPHNAMSIGDVEADMIVAYPTGVRAFVLEG